MSACILCGQLAHEMHHIINRSHISGRYAENWRLNMAPLCRGCHQRLHVERAVNRKILWEAMGYTILELMVFVVLGAHPKAPMYPLVRVRAAWAYERLEQEAQDDLALLVPQIESVGPEAFKAFARLADAKPMPGWI